MLLFFGHKNNKQYSCGSRYDQCREIDRVRSVKFKQVQPACCIAEHNNADDRRKECQYQHTSCGGILRAADMLVFFETHLITQFFDGCIDRFRSQYAADGQQQQNVLCPCKMKKTCKNEKLGIDFTSNEIQGIKDMINHIRTINSNYDIAKIFLFFANKLNIEKDEKFDESNSENCSKEEKDNPNLINEEKKNFPQDFSDINKLDINKLLLLNSINNFNNLNLMTLNYFNNASVANNYVNFLLFMNYLQCFNNPNLFQQSSLFNGISSFIPSLNNNLNNNISNNKFN